MDFLTGCEGIECVWMPAVVTGIFWIWVWWEYKKQGVKDYLSGD